MTIFEVKKYGVTVEFTRKILEAEEAFSRTAPGGVVMYRHEGSQKYPIKTKDR